MAFTFDETLTTDLARVRLSIGDTSEESALLSDALIDGLIREQGSWQSAVIAALEYILLAYFSSPNFTADWLRVDFDKGRASYLNLLASRRSEFGFSAVSAGAVHPYRVDSRQAGEPDYTTSEYGGVEIT
jgi:hypothetical protein